MALVLAIWRAESPLLFRMSGETPWKARRISSTAIVVVDCRGGGGGEGVITQSAVVAQFTSLGCYKSSCSVAAEPLHR